LQGFEDAALGSGEPVLDMRVLRPFAAQQRAALTRILQLVILLEDRGHLRAFLSLIR
jgi:hypothetical protein